MSESTKTGAWAADDPEGRGGAGRRRAGAAGHHGLPRGDRGRAGDAPVPRHGGESVEGDRAEGQGRHRHHHRVHPGDDRRRLQAHHHAARLLRHRRRRVLPAQKARALGQPPRHGRQEDQVRGADHAGLHEGRGRGKEDRRPGHGAEEGLLSRGPDLDQVRLGADPVDHAHPHRVQRRHARHPAGPDQAADQLVVRAAEPRVQGQGLDPEHPVDRHHGRGDGRRVHGQAQVQGQGQHDQGRDRPHRPRC